jgi:excisionase family DNA binding protein
MNGNPQELVTAQEVAQRFGVTVGTVNRWTREHRIPCMRASRRVVRYTLADVEAAIHQRQKGADHA